MELTQPTRPALGIDLNESPSSQSLPRTALSVVRSFHAHLTPPPGGPADLPGPSNASFCGACGLPETHGQVVVCDACERGFHLGCAVAQSLVLDDWICKDCVKNAVPVNRWPLGLKKSASPNLRLLDINSLPPTDGEGEGATVTDVLHHSRTRTPDGNSFSSNPFGFPVTHSNLLHLRNGFGFQKAAGDVTNSVKLGYEDILRNKQTVRRIFEEVDLHSLSEGIRSSNHSGMRLPSQNPGEMYLWALREYILEKHCVLEEGWHVEFKQSTSSGEINAVYCAPDGKTFESMAEVGCYLGLMSNSDTVGLEIKHIGSASPQVLSQYSTRRNYGSVANGVSENKTTLTRSFCREQSSGIQTIGCNDKIGSCVQFTEAVPEETGGSEFQKLNDGFPVQYEDFFVLSVGKIDARPSYHNLNQMWPVGYRSFWHDRITGSLFICYVSDGGDSGPIFKVRRCSCSAFPIPDGSTVLCRTNLSQSDPKNEEKSDDLTSTNMDFDEDYSVIQILSEPSPPGEHDILSCLGSSSSECLNVQSSNDVQPKESLLCERPGNSRDEIGEFSVEGSSSSSAWSMISTKLIDACRKVYIQTGTLKFFCNHGSNRTCSSDWDVRNGSNKEKFVPLAKFCGSSDFVNIPSFIRSDKELETFFEVLMKWLYQDRFGLDVEFVQEIIEQLPGTQACSRYVSLKERSSSSFLLTVGNGYLQIKQKDGVGAQDEARSQTVEDPMIIAHCLPSGKPISSMLPSQLVSDLLQVWEFLYRFHDVLGLKEPLSIDDLEKELITPWSDGLDLLEKFGMELQEIQDVNSCRIDGTSGNIISSCIESNPAVSGNNPHAFIQMETGAMKEASRARLASVTYSRCTGFALTKIHKSLLRVIISELQSKVAAVLDPNFDNGESKSKRGRKKDTDCWNAAKRINLNILPLNELTWPELVRRYILAVLSMEGNLDSAEVTNRESGKVFRCLQGDGGVLCGSLTGVAGIEADALLLAEATRKVFGYLNPEKDILSIDEVGSDGTSSCEKVTVNDDNVPEWAKVLEPVRKLPTNVGARIKKCVNEALEKDPPEWAKKILEHSISKEVYKGNASGPTKKAVLSVLADVNAEGLQKKHDKEKKIQKFISISDIIMKQCRIVLRHAAAVDDAKVFCNLLGRKLINCSDNDDEGILGSPAMVSRPLDFRTIDLRLAVGAYGGSHEAFHEDVQEFWSNVRIAYGDQPDLVQLAEKLYNTFESLYEEEVVALLMRLVGYRKSECLSAEAKKEIDEILVSASEIPKAPWEEGVCKVCGVDKDDDSVLLCDTCDAEYHTYCLNPPLIRIPEGNWYCPSCVAGTNVVQEATEGSEIIRWRRKKHGGEVTHLHLDSLAHLAAVIEEKEYWELTVDERTLLLKFLCDELLNSSLIRQHLEQSAEASSDLLPKLRSLYVEWRTLKYREEKLASKAAKVEKNPLISVVDAGSEQGSAAAVTFTDAFSDDFSQPKGSQICSGPIGVEDQSKYTPAAVVDNQLPGNSSTHLVSSNSDGFELNSVRNEISLMQNSITSIETQLLKQSLRREFLGSDSFGRLYWVLAESGTLPWVFGNENVELQLRGKIVCHSIPEENSSGLGNSSMWVSYHSDTEIKELVDCLKDNDPRERKLKESILLWQKLRFRCSEQMENQDSEERDIASSRSTNNEDNFISNNCLITQAYSLLETKYDPCFRPETTESLKKRGKKTKVTMEQKMHRCECLELIWPMRHHCLSCHQTFSTAVELEGHNSKCNIVPPVTEKSKENSDILKGKGEVEIADASKSRLSEFSSRLIKYQNDGLICPFDFEDICSKFLIKNSNKELVKEIGLIGSNGNPSFVFSVSPYLSDLTLMLGTPEEADKPKADEHLVLSPNNSIASHGGLSNICGTFKGDNNAVTSLEEKDNESSVKEVGNCCVVPKSSLKPLVGKACHILRQLKINLLDMDALLTEEALRPSKAHLERRRAWRAFVKSAETIYEMVQAIIVFEDMIRSEYLRNTWWYWSSLSAAAKISTLSSLALHIYSLDAAINYEKISPHSDVLEPSGKSDQTQKKKPNKKRKEPEG